MGAQSEGHLDDESKILLGLAGANDHLYRFDNNHGVVVAGLADPMALEFAATGVGAGQYTKLTSRGNTIFATGRNWFGNTVLDVFDTSTPELPVLAASNAVGGLDTFSLSDEPGFVLGAGNQPTLHAMDTTGPVPTRGAPQ